MHNNDTPAVPCVIPSPTPQYPTFMQKVCYPVEYEMVGDQFYIKVGILETSPQAIHVAQLAGSLQYFLKIESQPKFALPYPHLIIWLVSNPSQYEERSILWRESSYAIHNIYEILDDLPF